MKRRLVCWLPALLVVAAAMPAHARMGGGGGFSGGGGGGGFSGGGGGGGGILDCIWLLFQLVDLCIEAPAIGIPLVLCIIGVIVWLAQTPTNKVASYSSASGAARVQEQSVWLLKAGDHAFSRPVFIDFAQLLYTRTREGQGRGALDSVAAWLRPDVLAQVRREGTAPLRDIIIGSTHVEGLTTMEVVVQMRVVFMVNYIEEKDKPDAILATEHWTFERKAGLQSQPPEKMHALACSSCGAAAEVDLQGKCKFCGQVVNRGEFGWVVSAIKAEKQPRPPLSVEAGAASADAPTRYDPLFGSTRKRFMVQYPKFSWSDFEAEVRHAFTELQLAWTDRQWDRARPFTTDNLFNEQRFWMQRYLQQGWVNKLEDIQVNSIQPVHIETDQYYDSITVRIIACMKDYTVDGSGQVVGGDAATPHPFSEYWTLVRSAGLQKAEPRPGFCPNCGAPLDVTMTGACKYCNSVITTGKFGWVLSIIDQDSTYAG